MNMPDTNMERMMQENWQVTLDETTGEMKISRNSAHYIIHDMLCYRSLWQMSTKTTCFWSIMRMFVKFLYYVFRDCKGPVQEHYIPRGTTIISLNTTLCLQLGQNVVCPMCCYGMIMHYHTANATTASFECLLHPSYSPDFTPCGLCVWSPQCGAIR